jgi:hypothetical protein
MKKAVIFNWPCALILVIGVASYATSSLAVGTADERAACTPDVFRLCGSEIPNVTKIVACLKEKKAQLSPACKTVMSAPATTTTASTASQTRSLVSAASYWCDFHGVARDPGQQNWLKWCGSAAKK